MYWEAEIMDAETRGEAKARLENIRSLINAGASDELLLAANFTMQEIEEAKESLLK